MSVLRESAYGGSRVLDPLTTTVRLNPHSKRMQLMNPNAATRDLVLPDARLFGLGWSIFLILNTNTGSNVVNVRNNGGTLLLALAAGRGARLGLLDNTTANGTWVLHDRVYGAVAEPKPTLAFCFGGNSTTGGTPGIEDDATPLSYDWVTQACVARSRPAGDTSLRRHGAFTVSAVTYKVGAFAGGMLSYTVDTYTVKTERSFSVGAANEFNKTCITLLNKGFILAEFDDIGEWTTPDNWSTLATHPTYVDDKNIGVNGTDTDDVFLLSGSISGSEENAHVVYNRTSDTFAEAARNGSIISQVGGVALRQSARYLGVVAGDHGGSSNDGVTPDTLHFSYDMTLGTTGSWFSRLASPWTYMQSAAGVHPSNVDVNILMAGNEESLPETGLVGGSENTSTLVEFWNTATSTWSSSPNALPKTKVHNSGHFCDLTNP